MKVYTKTLFYNLPDAFAWCLTTFGSSPVNRRWTYGKDNNDRCVFMNSVYEIEWFDFKNEADAALFLLRWA